MKRPDWVKTASMYEVNVRQYTPEGTLNAFAAHLPRLASMGVTLVWLMPIQPIGVKNRKGTLGSNYSVRDYTAVNPEFGTLDDLKALVGQAHALGIRVLLDWVANHTAWDHPWIEAHPEWYQTNARGRIQAYHFKNGSEEEVWEDVVGLNYAQKPLWKAMIEALLYWVREADLDGYRCDVAGLVPTEFWIEARAALEVIKPVFLLAEWQTVDVHRAFDMSYDWKTYDLFRGVAAGTKTARDLASSVVADRAEYPANALRMVFTSNHDKNSWVASDAEAWGDRRKTFAALSFLLPGMPLIYSGQEAGLERRLAFFEKDPLAWNSLPYEDVYKGLLRLKATHPALANGPDGGRFEVVEADDQLLVFRRISGPHRLTAAFNLGPRSRPLRAVDGLSEETIEPWGYRVDPGFLVRV